MLTFRQFSQITLDGNDATNSDAEIDLCDPIFNSTSEKEIPIVIGLLAQIQISSRGYSLFQNEFHQVEVSGYLDENFS
jgi:hypothetical protein